MAQEQRFELVSTLGRGGMAEVFLGWMHSVGGLRRKVAIKRILPELIQKQSSLYQKMFVDEARLAFQLEHDNIVRVYDVGQTSNTFFIVMEYIEGYDLKSIMENLRDRQIIFPLGVAMYITLQVCAGLGYAHTLTDADGRPLGLIHNDISPPNILIGRHGDVKVSDFGLSDARSNDVTTPEGMIKGKFAYISPESTHNPPKITPCSDIFSIGICFWEMLAGRKLFQRASDLDTFRAVKECKIPSLREFRSDIPEEINRVVLKALAKDPAQRYQTCEAFYLDLASVATALEIPLNRYDLSWLVNDLAGNKWKEFVGEKVSADVQKDLEAELGGMLPPGDAEMLAELVTGISEAVDVEVSVSAKAENGNWVADVFSDVGFEEGEVVFADKKHRDPEPEKKSSTSNANKVSLSGEVPKISSNSNKAVVNFQTPTKELSGMLPSSKSVLSTRSSLHGRNQRVPSLVWVCLVMTGVMIGAILTVCIFMMQ